MLEVGRLCVLGVVQGHEEQDAAHHFSAHHADRRADGPLGVPSLSGGCHGHVGGARQGEHGGGCREKARDQDGVEVRGADERARLPELRRAASRQALRPPVRKIVAIDYCWKAVGFPSTALSVEPAGFADWHAAWKEVQHSDVVDTVVASACLLRKPVLGEVAFDSTDLLDLLNDVAGDVDLCAADGLNGYATVGLRCYEGVQW